MAVSALELRPRGAVAILDSALRLCARNTGVWALTLPSGALVTWALLHLADTLAQRGPLLLPALWVTLAWLTRGLFQGAACHYVQELLVGAKEPGTWSALRAALGRTPSLLIAVGFLFVFNAATVTFSGGLAFFFLSAHLVGYAATMQGKGSALGLYAVCSRMLGPARTTASVARLLLAGVQLLTFLNLHIAANFLCFLGRKLIGIDLTYAERFASLDNPTWLLFLAALTFTLFEPIRVATATLLLVDGRVRQEGLDLLAAVQQLPERNTPRAALRGAGVALVLLCALLAAPAARAEEAPASDGTLGERLSKLAEFCERPPEDASQWRSTAEALSPEEQLKFKRLLNRVEAEAYGDDECGPALHDLEQGVALAGQTVTVERARQDARATAARAKAILARPEFAVTPPAPERTPDVKEPTVPPEKGLWARFLDWLNKLLEEWFKRRDTAPPPKNPTGVQGSQVANTLAIVLIALTVVALAVVLIRTLMGQKKPEVEHLEVATLQSTALSTDPASALSKPPEGWAHTADEMAARGNYREAVRCLYLALLSRLHRDGAITYDVTLSNWDYLRHFKGQREWLPPFRELTRRFDFAWYGNVPVGVEGYQDFRLLTEPMLNPPTSREASGA